MWSGHYNPRHSFDALFSTSGDLGHLDRYSSGSRMELPGGGFIDLPGTETTTLTHEQNEQTFHSDLFEENLDSKSSSGSRIELPGGGYIELPHCEIDPRDLNKQPRCHSDIFQDVDFGAQPSPAHQRNQDMQSALLSKIQELERKLADKDDIIRQEENKNQILREHLNRFVQIADEKNMELYSLRFEANGAINELQTRISQLTTQVQDLRSEVNKKEAECSEMHCQVKLVALQRSMLSKERDERVNLQEKIKSLEKSIQDLTTKNTILEHELTVLPKMMSSKGTPKTIVKAQINHCDPGDHRNESWDRAAELMTGLLQTVDEQKTRHRYGDDPECIEVLESHSTQALACNDNTSYIKRSMSSSFRQWLKKKSPKTKRK